MEKRQVNKVNFVEEQKIRDQQWMTTKGAGRFEGVQLTDQQQEYLLKHFFLVVVGKPGSGKTFLVKQMLNSQSLYNKKFDQVYVVTPSVAKTGIKVPKANTNTEFQLAWIKQKVDECNTKQFQKLYKLVNPGSTSIGYTNRTLAQGHLKAFSLGDDMQSGTNQPLPAPVAQFDREQKFFSVGVLQTLMGSSKKQGTFLNVDATTKGKKKVSLQDSPDVDWIENNIVSKLSPEQQQQSHMNVLFVFDDVIGQIKINEANPYLAQLFLNRRHLIANGTVSIILISQKYTMIPARIRSQASWIIVFKLNPVDFDTLYKDVVTMEQKKWKELLEYIFGVSDMNKDVNQKHYNNLGIWVEYDKYFKNFNLIYQK